MQIGKRARMLMAGEAQKRNVGDNSSVEIVVATRWKERTNKPIKT